MTEGRYRGVEGDPVEVSERALSLPRLRQLLRATLKQPAFKVLGATKRDQGGVTFETLVVEIELNVAQDTKVDIRARERVSITCNSVDDRYPDVRALRRGFPHTAHQFDHDPENEATPLCLFETPFDEQRLVWNPSSFLAAITLWFELTAVKELHPDDQPIEPFFYGSGSEFIVPKDMPLDGSPAAGTCAVADFMHREPDDKGHFTATLRLVSGVELAVLRQTSRPLCRVFVFQADPREHGPIHRPPRTLGELAALFAPLGIDLKPQLREDLRNIARDTGHKDQDRVLLLIRTPLLRNGVNAGENLAGFHFAADVGALGDGMDATAFDGATRKRVAVALLVTDEAKADALQLTAINVYRDTTAELAAVIAGVSSERGDCAVILGAGAIGSHVATLLARSGWSRFAIVDHDHMRTHNLVRHILPRGFVGRNKAVGVSEFLGGLWPGGAWTPIPKRAQHATDDPSFATHVRDAKVILDCSASQAASRVATLDWSSDAQRISMFLTPDGLGGALLAEDRDRRAKLDAVEAQYYRLLINDAVGDHHLTGKVAKHRYGLGCRDRTFVLSPDAIMTFSAELTRMSRARVGAESASITVLRSLDAGGIEATTVDVAASRRQNYHRWTIVYDEALLRKMHVLRDAQVPNETGGPLLGYYDVERRIVYLVDALDAPPDSESGPKHFKRGVVGLADRLEEVRDRTGGVVIMVGDWHSHPPSVPAQPSTDDLELLVDQGLAMIEDGLPGLIAIVGEEEVSFLCAMDAVDA